MATNQKNCLNSEDGDNKFPFNTL